MSFDVLCACRTKTALKASRPSDDNDDMRTNLSCAKIVVCWPEVLDSPALLTHLRSLNGPVIVLLINHTHTHHQRLSRQSPLPHTTLPSPLLMIIMTCTPMSLRENSVLTRSAQQSGAPDTPALAKWSSNLTVNQSPHSLQCCLCVQRHTNGSQYKFALSGVKHTLQWLLARESAVSTLSAQQTSSPGLTHFCQPVYCAHFNLSCAGFTPQRLTATVGNNPCPIAA